MSKEIFFSVIIPIYNVEKYLCECIDSVLAQTFNSFEIILVDDGSPDKCPQMCDEYCENDKRIKVIHKKNGGLSEARNYGINAACGQYLLFLDSDDYWDDNDALQKIYNSIREAECLGDIVIFQAKLLYPDGTIIADNGSFDKEFNSLQPLEALEYMSANGLLIGSACSKVVRKNFLVENNLYFQVGIRSEDIDWILRVANCLPKYLYADQYFYIYRKGRSESITSNIDSDYLMQFADMLEKFISYPYVNSRVKKCLLGYVAYEFSILMAKTANLSHGFEKKILIQRVQKMEKILEYDIHPKVKKIKYVKKILGCKLTIRLLGLYLKYRKR